MQDLRDLLHRVSSARVLSDRAPPASLSCGGDAFGSDGSCRDADYDMLTLKKRLQRHTRLLPFQVDRPGAMQVCKQHPVCTATPFAALTRRQKRFETALDCLRGLGVPIVGQGERASHVLCCCDEWQLHQGQQREQEVPVVIDALQFSLHPPYKLYQTLLP